ncbi:MAG TPA: hypothetical protein VGD40_09650 [Chryseosolibacter sp.]
MKRAIIAVLSLITLFSCTERLVCPAYQSAYIYDKDQLRKKFSYFLDDSTPKVYTASKNKYLVAEPMSYRSRVRSLQTVKMKPVPVVVPDSIANPGADSVNMEEMARATQSVIDSTYIVDVPRDTATAATAEDSVYVITKDKELRLLKYNSSDSLDYDSIQQRYVKQKPQYYISDVRYNLDQDHYMWYLRDALVLPDVRLAKMQQSGEGGGDSGKETKKKQGLKGFFKNLFKKKKKEEVDSASLVQPPKEEFDYVDTLSQAEVPQPGQVTDEPKARKKGGLFKKKEKKVKPPKKDAKKPEEEVDEPKKEEDEDDGF